MPMAGINKNTNLLFFYRNSTKNKNCIHWEPEKMSHARKKYMLFVNAWASNPK